MNSEQKAFQSPTGIREFMNRGDTRWILIRRWFQSPTGIREFMNKTKENDVPFVGFTLAVDKFQSPTGIREFMNPAS